MYPISEDSLFLAEILRGYIKKIKNKKEITYLDMGTGSGILASVAEKAGIRKENVIAVDVDKECVNFVKKNGFNCIQSNLFSRIKKKFNIITFNAPYLPENKFDKKPDTTGGKKGDEISIRFIKEARKHLLNKGIIFLLISSFTPFERIKKLKPKVIAKKKLFFEELLILEIKSSI